MNPPGTESPDALRVLKGVSRSFYLTLRILPREIRAQVSLAYLLARAGDTIADTGAIPRDRRIAVLHALRGLSGVPELSILAEHQALPAERELLRRLPEWLDILDSLPPDDARLIRDLLHTIIGGQIFDLERFPGEGERRIAALADAAELDRYTYMVAGCVGEFWTRICAAHFPRPGAGQSRDVEELGIRFGKGLQLVNVLRDLPRDLRMGRCYLPVAEPAALLEPEAFASVRMEYGRWLDTAVGHLDAGWQYALQIPPQLWRLRLACAWPIWIGLKTIALLRRRNPLDPEAHSTVARSTVIRMVLGSFVIARSRRLLDAYHRRLRRTISPPSAP